jgi:lysophospholipase L1-like esterase
VRYLALGDSYTIGTGASSASRSYPSILAERLARETGRKVALTNPAVNGFTTLNLIDKELRHLAKVKPSLVSVLIGVNDLVQGRTADQYRGSLTIIYDAVAAAGLPAGQVAAISIPDWSVVPAAAQFGDPPRLRRLTDALNEIARHEAMARNFLWIDIQEVSTSSPSLRGWISSDGLHPGDIQYAAWADVIWEGVRDRWVSAARG